MKISQTGMIFRIVKINVLLYKEETAHVNYFLLHKDGINKTNSG